MTGGATGGAAPAPQTTSIKACDGSPAVRPSELVLACADAVADRIGAQRLRVPGYYPHTQHPAEVNAALRRLWRDSVR